MMAVGIMNVPTFSAGKPQVLFESPYDTAPDANYDVTSDGRRFLMVETVEPEAPVTQLNVVLNWSEELKRLVPTN